MEKKITWTEYVVWYSERFDRVSRRRKFVNEIAARNFVKSLKSSNKHFQLEKIVHTVLEFSSHATSKEQPE